MKIIHRSNFNYEDHRGDERLVAAQIAVVIEADIICAALNAAAGTGRCPWTPSCLSIGTTCPRTLEARCVAERLGLPTHNSPGSVREGRKGASALR